jgi:hypothetical protein
MYQEVKLSFGKANTVQIGAEHCDYENNIKSEDDAKLELEQPELVAHAGSDPWRVQT